MIEARAGARERMNSPLEIRKVRLRGLYRLTFVHDVQIVAAADSVFCRLLRLEVGMGINHSSMVEVYLHLVWATWDRLPLLTPEVRDRVYLSMREEGARLKAEIIAMGGIEDHVHVLLRLPATVSIAQMVKQLKGSSSHLANREVLPRGFKWQGGYSAGSVSRRLLPIVRSYVLNQEEHHRKGTIYPKAEI